MKDPHQLSSAYILDPAYSKDTRAPEASTSSLHCGVSSARVHWLYAVGDVASFLMAESRRRAFRLVHNIAHPGFFRPPYTCVYFSSTFAAKAIDENLLFNFYHSGDMRLVLNGRFVGSWSHTTKPSLRIADLKPFLVHGTNSLSITLCSSCAPACFASEFPTDGWQSSIDAQSWEIPETYPFVDNGLFPHQESLPSLSIFAKRKIADLYDFGVEVIGTVGIKGSIVTRRFKPGESQAEAENARPEFDEQPFLTIDRNANPSAISEEAAFRYLRLVEGFAPDPNDVQCHLALHPAAYRGAFACSDSTATQIWMHAAYTLRLCLRDITVDGLKRDRLPWVGDLYLSLRCNACSFAENNVFLRTLLAFYHESSDQHDFSGIFDYTLFWVMAAGDYVLYSGDLAGAQYLWPRVRNVLRHLNRICSSEGLLTSEAAKWIFLDWADVPKSGYLLIIQSLYIQALEAAALLASAAGEEAMVTRLKRNASQLRSQSDGTFWNQSNRTFDDSTRMPSSSCGSRHANAFAVLGEISGMERLRQALKKARHSPEALASTTPYMRYFECAALCRIGDASEMVSEVGRYWGGMLAAGASTFWEAYDERHLGAEHYCFYGRPFGKSLCHAWSAGPVALYSMELFNLRPLQPGWKQFTFSPANCGLSWASTKIPTPYGDIAAEFDGDIAELEIPAGCAWVDLASGSTIAAEKTNRSLTFRKEGTRWISSLGS
ncbi:MAG TPA: alpha-L-rhamnosidase C-terminal domain-containing protein [Opitutaceae bacterium]